MMTNGETMCKLFKPKRICYPKKLLKVKGVKGLRKDERKAVTAEQFSSAQFSTLC